MPFASTTPSSDNDLSPEEWEELISLKDAITESITSVHPMKMERFTELFARSLAGKGDPLR
jgi:hypothetical protein